MHGLEVDLIFNYVIHRKAKPGFLSRLLHVIYLGEVFPVADTEIYQLKYPKKIPKDFGEKIENFYLDVETHSKRRISFELSQSLVLIQRLLQKQRVSSSVTFSKALEQFEQSVKKRLPESLHVICDNVLENLAVGDYYEDFRKLPLKIRALVLQSIWSHLQAYSLHYMRSNYLDHLFTTCRIEFGSDSVCRDFVEKIIFAHYAALKPYTDEALYIMLACGALNCSLQHAGILEQEELLNYWGMSPEPNFGVEYRPLRSISDIEKYYRANYAAKYDPITAFLNIRDDESLSYIFYALWCIKEGHAKKLKININSVAKYIEAFMLDFSECTPKHLSIWWQLFCINYSDIQEKLLCNLNPRNQYLANLQMAVIDRLFFGNSLVRKHAFLTTFKAYPRTLRNWFWQIYWKGLYRDDGMSEEALYTRIVDGIRIYILAHAPFETSFCLSPYTYTFNRISMVVSRTSYYLLTDLDGASVKRIDKLYELVESMIQRLASRLPMCSFFSFRKPFTEAFYVTLQHRLNNLADVLYQRVELDESTNEEVARLYPEIAQSPSP